MLGAIIGDIAGSRFEFSNYRRKDFEILEHGCFFTDDSIMTLAVAKALMQTNGGKTGDLKNAAITCMQEVGRLYPNCGYGTSFYHWIYSDSPKPYNSYGNGAAMRVSAVGFIAQSEQEVFSLAQAVTEVSHNHPEGIKGATATALAVYLAKNGASKDEIRDRMKEFYSLDFTINSMRKVYYFNETCQNTVPQALVAFLESESFEDAIKTAVSVGGDSDTLTAITGGIAEAYYGVPTDIREKALTYLDERLLKIYLNWEKFILKRNASFGF